VGFQLLLTISRKSYVSGTAE